MSMCGPDVPSSSQPETPPEVLESYRTMNNISQQQWDQYQERYVPLENQVIAQAQEFATPQYAEQQASRANADVIRAYDTARAQREAQMQDFGLDPSQMRYQLGEREMNIGQAAAQAGAQTNARDQARLLGFNTLAGVAGRGDARVNQSISAAQTGGNIANQATATQMQGYGIGVNAAGQQSAGIGSLVGSGIGAAAMFM